MDTMIAANVIVLVVIATIVAFLIADSDERPIAFVTTLWIGFWFSVFVHHFITKY